MNSNLDIDIFQRCRTCMKESTSASSFFFLDSSPTHLTIRQKLNNCIPELDLSIISNSVICSECADVIKSFYEFKQKCLQSEIQVNKYIQHVQHTGLVNLVEVVRFNQPHHSSLDMKLKIEDIEITEDLVCDTIEVNEDTESMERTYLLTLQKIDREDVLFNTFENYIDDNLSTAEPRAEYSDTNNRNIAQDSFSKTDAYFQCYKCGHKASSKLKLILHLKSHKQKHFCYKEVISKKLQKNYKNLFYYYRCFLCNYLTKYRPLFNFHNRIHLTKKNYRHTFQHKDVQTKFVVTTIKVNKMNMKNDKTKYINHCYNEHHFKNRSKCVVSTQLNSLISNTRTKVVGKPFKCSIREYHFNQKQNLKPHMQIHIGDKPFSCSVCEFHSSQKSSLTQHMRTHTGEKPFSCSVCEYQCKQKPHLVQHMRIHTGDKSFSCSVCEFRCSQKSSLTQHMRTHTGEKPFSCSVCEFHCSRKYLLKLHMRNHTGEKPFSCSVCEFHCSRKYHLKLHMRNHTGEKPFSCSVCKYQCKQKPHLVQHMRIHTGEKPFSCSVCEYQFNQKSSLNQHMRTHTGEKPFSCSVCNYRCRRKEHLKRHIRMHMGEKPFSCSVCEYQCGQKENLKRHMKIHTEKKLFSCFNCDYQCSRKKDLMCHMKAHARRNRKLLIRKK